MSPAFDDGIVEILRREGFTGKHLLYLAVRLIPDGIIGSDSLINTEVRTDFISFMPILDDTPQKVQR